MSLQSTGMDHTKTYTVIDGHLITLSFSDTLNTDLRERLKSILLTSETDPQVRREPSDNGRMQSVKKGA